MRDAVVEEKFDSLVRCLERVRARTPSSADALLADIDAQDILSLNLERAVQLAVDVALHVLGGTAEPAPQTMGEAFLALVRANALREQTAERMVKAVGFRNLSVHAYRKLDWSIVFVIATKHLDDFRAFMREISAYVDA